MISEEVEFFPFYRGRRCRCRSSRLHSLTLDTRFRRRDRRRPCVRSAIFRVIYRPGRGVTFLKLAGYILDVGVFGRRVATAHLASKLWAWGVLGRSPARVLE